MSYIMSFNAVDQIFNNKKIGHFPDKFHGVGLGSGFYRVF